MSIFECTEAEQFLNEPMCVLFIMMIILLANNLWAIYLLMRQILVVYRAQNVPLELRPYLSQDLFLRMRAHKLHTSYLIIINTLFIVVVCGCIELYFGFYPFLWRLVDSCAFAGWMKHEVCMSIVYVIFLGIYITIKSLPAHIYNRCCIVPLVPRPRYSFIQRLISEILQIIISLLIMVTIVTVVVFMVQAFDQWAFIGLYLIVVLMLAMVIVLMPFLIDPFMGKRIQLENEALQAGLERLTSRVGFPMRYVYIIHIRDSKAGSNAFFFGSCCLKRIVIFDTLLLNRGLANSNALPPGERDKGLGNEQVLAVVAHELGHWKKGHFYKSLLMFVNLFITFLLLALCFPHGPIYEAVGFEKGIKPIIVGIIIILSFVLTPYLNISNFLMLTMTRRFEYQADKFAFRLGYSGHLKLALLKLYADNMVFPLWDPCYSVWYHSHPTIMQRLQHLDDLEATN